MYLLQGFVVGIAVRFILQNYHDPSQVVFCNDSLLFQAAAFTLICETDVVVI